MNVEVRGRHVELNPELRAQVQGRVQGALERFSGHIRRATVRVVDARNAQSKICRITLDMDAGGQFYAEETSETLAAAISGALDNTRTLLRRTVGSRQRGLARGTRRVLVDMHV